jgi:subtilisin family serine protease
MFKFFKNWLFPQRPTQTAFRGQTFILEPILTPSGIIDTGDDSSFDLLDPLQDDTITIDNPDLPDLSTDDINSSNSDDFQEVGFLPANAPKIETHLDTYTSGIFTVGDTGEIEIDYLWDGGKYQGQLALFNLQGLDNYQPGSREYILEVLNRILEPDSETGHIVIDDKGEGAKFSGEVGEGNFNTGDYTGIKTLKLQPGTHWGAMLIPNGTAEELWETLNDPDAKLPRSMRPLFSLATANPDDGLHLGQIADVTGDGHTFVFEDLRVDGRTDRDYNDLIFQIKGATGDAVNLDEVINPANDWRESEIGQSLLDYATFRGQENSIAEHLPDTVQYAIERAENLDSYDPQTLNQTHQWIVGVSSNELSPDLLTLLQAENQGAVGHIPNTYLWEFSSDVTTTQVGAKLNNLAGVEFAYPLVPHHHELRSLPNDTPLWHLHNTGQTGTGLIGGTPGEDIKVIPAWDLGYKGKGVTIGIVDDGLQYNHPSLQSNYRSDLSRDFYEKIGSIYDSNALPYINPTFGLNIADSHGTAMAAIAAGDGTNRLYGAAPEASLVGLRLVPNGKPNDLTEADSLSYLNDDIDIFNNSWGPPDKLNQLAAPDPLAQMVLHTTATQGRDGKGSIFVWAAGNGQQYEGNINYDGYANSRYVIAVGALDHNGQQAEYSEPGASLLVSTYGGDATAPILSAHAHPKQLESHSIGTSAAAALTSGVIALMLEANPNLTWRDVRHILVETARKNDPTDAGWETNTAGYEMNYKYGFGAVDAEAAVKAAKDWTLVGTEVKVSGGLKTFKKPIPGNGSVVSDRVIIDEDITVEWAEVMFDAKHDRPEDLEVVLISPDGTRSILAQTRDPKGTMGGNYNKWVFTSVRSWGESAKGEWTLEVRDQKTGKTGTWNQWKLNLYGAEPTVTIEATDPDASENGDPGEFTIYRTGSNKFPLTVDYAIRGQHHWSRPPATNGTDYQQIPGNITIPAGASSATFSVQPLPDNDSEWPETVRLQLTEKEGYEVGEQNIDVVTIADSNLPELLLYGKWYGGTPILRENSFAYTSESGNQEKFLLRRIGGDISKPLTVYYTLPGKAENGVDYKYLSGSITIPAEQNDLGFEIEPIDDNEIEGEENFELILTPDSTYLFGTRNGRVYDRIPGTIWDNDDKPTVKIEATQNQTILGGKPGQFTITRTPPPTGNLSQPLTVEYWVENRWGWISKAKNGIDFSAIPETIEIPAGQASVTIDIEPLKGDLKRTAEIYLKSNPAYAMANYSASVSILDTNPTVTWKEQLGTLAFDSANGVAVDASGNAYIAGRTAGNLEGSSAGLSDAFLAKYDKNGILQWKQQDGTLGYDEAKGIAVDALGNSYVTGWTDGELGGSRDAWLSKYDSNGILQWKKLLSSSVSNENTGYDISKGAITLGQDGAVYLTGYTQGNLDGANRGQADAFVAKFDSNGDRVWVRQVGSGAWDEANGAAADSDGNVYIAGITQGKLGDAQQGDKDAWVAKFNSNGTRQWVQQLGTVASDEALGVAVDAEGRVYLAGHTRGWLGENYSNPDDWLGDIDAYWRGIHGDRSGLGGTYYGEGDAWVAQFDSDGKLAWKRLLGTTEADLATGIAADATGVYVTGTTGGNVVKTVGGDDAFVAKYDARGALLWKRQFGSRENDGATGIAVGDEGIYVAGVTSGDLGGTSKGGRDAWVAKLS